MASTVVPLEVVKPYKNHNLAELRVIKSGVK
jgi:hypothetical protein